MVALASPGQVALEHTPARSCRPDELALDYENVVHAFVGNSSTETSAPQRSALLRVDKLIGAMIGGQRSDLWTESAVITHRRWAEIRAAAQQALDAMSWGAEQTTCQLDGQPDRQDAQR